MSALLIVATLGTPAFQNSSGPTLPPSCDQSFSFTGVTTATQEVQWVGNENIFICHIAVSGTAAASVVQLQTGTSTNCKNNNAVALMLASQGTDFTTSLGSNYGIGNVIAPVAAGSNLCIQATASAQGTVSYTQYGPATDIAGVPSIYQMTNGVSIHPTTGTTGTLTNTFSQTPRAGDLLLAVAFNDDGGDATPPVPFVTTPANWLLAASQLGTVNPQGIFVFSRVSDGTENSLTVTFNQTNNNGMYDSLYLVEIANAGTVDAFAGNDTAPTPSTSSTVTGATITPSTSNELALAIFAANDTSDIVSSWGAVGAGWTEGYGQFDAVNFAIQELQFNAAPTSGVGIAPTVTYTTGGNTAPRVTNISLTIHHT